MRHASFGAAEGNCLEKGDIDGAIGYVWGASQRCDAIDGGERAKRSEAKRSEAKRASLLEDEHTRDEVREMVLDGRFDSPKDAPGQTRERVEF